MYLFEVNIGFNQTRFDLFFYTLLGKEASRIVIRILAGADFAVQRVPIVLSFFNPLAGDWLHIKPCRFRQLRAGKNRPLSTVFSTLPAYEP